MRLAQRMSTPEVLLSFSITIILLNTPSIVLPVISSELGRALDDLDRLKAKQAQRDSLENNKDGVSSTWTNPNTGNSGKITPKRTEQIASGEFCREYEHEINVADKMETVKGTACRQPDGTWRVIN